MPLTPRGYRGSVGLVDFPLPVALDPARIAGFRYQDCAPGGADLRFTDADNTRVLPHEIESWDPQGTSIVWVRVPVLISNTVIRAFWRNPEAEPAPAETVWDAGFRGVWHLGDTLVDATMHGNRGSNAGSTGMAGVTGGARAFNGSAWIDCGNAASLNLTGNQLTLSAWIRPHVISGNAIISKSYAEPHVSPFYSWILYTTGSGLHCRIDTTSATRGSLATGIWQHVAAVYTASQILLYIDWKAVGSENNSATLAETPRNERIC